MGESSVLWLRVAAAFYSLGLLHALIMVFRRREGIFRVALNAFSIGALFHFVSTVETGLAQHHFPANDIFETLSFCALMISAAFLFIYRRYKSETISVAIFPLVFVMTLASAMRDPVGQWTSEAVRSTWLVVHIILVLIGYAALLFTAVAAVMYLMAERMLKRKAMTQYRILPPLGTLDELVSKSMAAGFTFITIGTIIGLVWAFVEHGTTWIGDSSITISLITWGVLLALVCLRAGAGWRGRKAAILSIVALGFCALTWIAHVELQRRLS